VFDLVIHLHLYMILSCNCSLFNTDHILTQSCCNVDFDWTNDTIS